MTIFTSRDVFETFEHDAFRFESRDSYAVDVEADDYARFLAGEPLAPPPDLPWFRGWLDRIREVTAQGRTFTRVRLLADPPTDYQRWELWATSYNEAAGESVRFLRTGRAAELGLPLQDWWLFDGARVAEMRFTEAGEPLGGTLTADPGTVARYRHLRDVALNHAVPLDQILWEVTVAPD